MYFIVFYCILLYCILLYCIVLYCIISPPPQAVERAKDVDVCVRHEHRQQKHGRHICLQLQSPHQDVPEGGSSGRRRSVSGGWWVVWGVGALVGGLMGGFGAWLV